MKTATKKTPGYTVKGEAPTQMGKKSPMKQMAPKTKMVKTGKMATKKMSPAKMKKC